MLSVVATAVQCKVKLSKVRKGKVQRFQASPASFDAVRGPCADLGQCSYGSDVTWGITGSGGSSSAVHNQLRNLQQL